MKTKMMTKITSWGCAGVLALSSLALAAQDYGEPEALTSAPAPIAKIAVLSAPVVPVSAAVALPASAAAPTAAAAPEPPQTPPKDDVFAGADKFSKGATSATSVVLGPDMLGMVTGKHGGDLAHKMRNMIVRTFEYPRPGMYNKEEVAAYRQKLRTGNWNCFIHTFESKTGESTDICNRPAPNGHGNEMVILTVEPKELTFVQISGDVSLEDLGKLGHLGGMAPAVPPPPPPPPASRK